MSALVNFLTPHPLRRPVLHVECESEGEAWAALEDTAA
jgi:hypothetical protein